MSLEYCGGFGVGVAIIVRLVDGAKDVSREFTKSGCVVVGNVRV